jgi:type VI secretion system secreted protein VgrG
MSLESCLPPLYQAEGILSDDPGDSGGKTVFGIDTTSNPNSPIWPEVHRLESAGTPPALWPEDVPLMNAARDTYKANYWDPCELDYFPDAMQLACFGCAVNQGKITMVRLLQRALIHVGARIVEDGDLGGATIAAVNAAPVGWLADAFWMMRAQNYAAVVDAHPVDTKFLHGWIKRLENGL